MIKKVKYNIYFFIFSHWKFTKGEYHSETRKQWQQKRKVAGKETSRQQEKEVEKQADTEYATKQSKKNLSKFNNKVQYIVYILCMI